MSYQDEVSIPCPACDLGELTVACYPGEPAVHWPLDRAHPGSYDEVDVTGQDCDCELDHERVRDEAFAEYNDRCQMVADIEIDARIEAHLERDAYA